jgi:hypothetical protein
MNETIYLIITLQHDSQLNNLKIEKNKDLGIFLYKEMNDLFKNEYLENSLQEIIVEKLYRHWTNMTVARKSNVQLLITGHAIGGGLAQILGMYLKGGTTSLLSHLNLKQYDEPTFAEMLQKAKVYTFSTPFVFLKEPKDVITDWNVLQRGTYNFVTEVDSVKVTAKTFFQKGLNMFMPGYIGSYIGVFVFLKPTDFAALISMISENLGWHILFGTALGEVVLFTSVFSIIIGVAMLGVSLYSLFLDPKVLFGALKSAQSKARSEPISWGNNYYSPRSNSKYAIVDQKFLETKTKWNRGYLHIKWHIENFFSNKEIVTRKALPAPNNRNLE